MSRIGRKLITPKRTELKIRNRNRKISVTYRVFWCHEPIMWDAKGLTVTRAQIIRESLDEYFNISKACVSTQHGN